MAAPRRLAQSIPRFDVRILGPFEVHRDGVRLPTDRWQKRIGRLFKLLVTAPGRRLSRDDLIDTLWPEASPQAGASNLRLLVHLLRQSLTGDAALGRPSHEAGAPAVLTHGGWVALNPDWDWDVDLDRFERLAASEELRPREEAAALYRGEPLPEDRYDDWAVPLRERIQRTWRQLCLQLARHYSRDGSPERAVQWLEGILERDPLDEEALRALLRLLAQLGRRAEALQRYRQFEQRLDEELDLRPAQETFAVVDRLRAADELHVFPAVPSARPDLSRQMVPVTPSYHFPSARALVGREAWLRQLLHDLDDRATDASGDPEDRHGPRLLVIEAEAGMGKSHLLGEVAQQARAQGFLTLAGGCYEQEGALPYGPIHDALLDYLRTQPQPLIELQLGDLLPDLVRVVPEARDQVEERTPGRDKVGQDERLRLFSAIARVFERISADRPLVLLLDDLHWADDATLQLVHFLLRQPPLTRFSIVGAYRAEEVEEGTTLAQIAAETRSRHRSRILSLPPLDEADLTMLLEDRLGGRCSAWLTRLIYARSAGNPFFAIQMLRLLQQEQRIRQGEAGWECEAGVTVDLPEAVREVVARRLRQLDRVEREALALAAVLGREFGFPALEWMWQGTEKDLFAALDGAVDAQVLSESESGYVFRHPVLWEVVYQRISSHRRPSLHRRAARAVETFYGEHTEEHAAELAWHCRAAGQKQRALFYALQAGDRAEAAFAHEQAGEQYTAARDLARELRDDAGEREALERLGRVRRVEGRYDDALEFFERAERMWHEAGDLDAEGRVVAQIGRVRFLQSMSSEGRRDVQAFLHAAGEQLADDTLAALHSVLSNLFAHEGLEEHLMVAEQASQRARTAGKGGLLAEAEISRSQALWRLGQHDEALRALKGAIPLAEEARDFHTLVRAFVNSAQILADLGEFARARSFAERGLETARREGDPLQITFLAHALADIMFRTGDWEEAGHLWEQATMAARSLGPTRISAWPLVSMSLLCLRQGRTEEATQYVAEGVGLAEAVGRTDAVCAARVVLSERDLMYGDAQAALTHVSAYCAESGDRLYDYLLLTVVALAHLALGDSTRAGEVAKRGLEQAAARGERPGVAQMQWVQGTILGRLGRWKEAEQVLLDAVSLAGAMSYPFIEALALRELATCYLEHGKRRQGQERLEAALAIFQRLQARPYIEQTLQTLERFMPQGTEADVQSRQ